MDQARLDKLLAELEPHELVFVQEYARTGKAGPSLLKARPELKVGTSYSEGYKMLRNPQLQTAIRAVRAMSGEDAIVQAADVLREWLTIALADPSELIRSRRLCCRRCYGVGHAYQWRDEQEYAQAVAEALRANEGRDEAPQLPDASGGVGFQHWHAPHPHCPGCGGEGHLDVHVADLDQVSDSARKLFAGIKQTKDGVEVKLRDQDGALANIARYLGMLGTDVRLKGSVAVANAGTVELTDEQRAALQAAVRGLVE